MEKNLDFESRCQVYAIRLLFEQDLISYEEMMTAITLIEGEGSGD